MTEPTSEEKFRAVVLSVVMVLSVVAGGVSLGPGVAAADGNQTAITYVDGSTGGDGTQSNPYETIQMGVNNASSGDTVIVESGTYSESVTVNQSVTLETDGDVTLDGSSIDDFGFNITVSDVTIHGFTVENYRAGIEAKNVTNVEIHATTVTGSDSQGITLDNVSESVVQNSTVSESAVLNSDLICQYHGFRRMKPRRSNLAWKPISSTSLSSVVT